MDENPQSEETLATDIKVKLANLEKYMPGQKKIVYDFAKFLSEYSNDQLVPAGFNLMAELAVHDLTSGINGFTGEPISGTMAGYPPILYQLLVMQIPDIAEALFGKEYGKQVKAIREQVNNRINEQCHNSETSELTTKAEVISLMKSSKTQAEWNANTDKVKVAFGGYPNFWYSAIILSGIAKEIEDNFS